jgi:DnaJ-class molecular chaperone
MTTALVTCPNCKGHPSTHWFGGPCTVCGGRGKTTPEKADAVKRARRAA